MVGRSRERLVGAVGQLEAPERHRLVEADLADYEQVDEASGDLAGEGTLLDGLVHCAGVFQPAPFEQIDPRTSSAPGRSMPGGLSTSPKRSHPNSVTEPPSSS